MLIIDQSLTNVIKPRVRRNPGNGYLKPCNLCRCDGRVLLIEGYLQNAASDQSLYCLLKLQEVKG